MSTSDENTYKFICTTVQSNAIKTLIEALKDILGDVNLRISPQGIQILTVEPNGCAIVHLNLVCTNFEHFYSQTEEFHIGVNIKSLYILLKTLGNNDVITLFVLQNDITRLHILIENKEKKVKDISKLKLLDFDEHEYDIPSVEFDCVIKMPSSDFQKICKDLSNIDDVVEIKNDYNTFSFSVYGDIGDKEIKIEENEYINIQQMQQSEPYSEKYQLKYLLSFVKSSNLCSSVEIYLTNHYPLVLIYSAGSLGSLKFLLSPFDNE
jgi:proliferating cell nuclear antigen